MKALTIAVIAAALTVSACGPGDKARTDGDPGLASARERARIIPAPPSGPVLSSTGTVVSTETAWVTLDHEGAQGLPAGRTRFRTWADVIAQSPGEPGDRVAFKAQKLGDGWALVEMTGR